MSASIYWQSVQGKRLDGQSTFAGVLGLPREFDSQDIRWLQGLAAGNADYRQDVYALLEAIEQHGRIRLWVEY